MKQTYESPVLEMLYVDNADILTASGWDDDQGDAEDAGI